MRLEALSEIIILKTVLFEYAGIERRSKNILRSVDCECAQKEKCMWKNGKNIFVLSLNINIDK